MKTIWKHWLGAALKNESEEVEVPLGDVLKVDFQHGGLATWILQAPEEGRKMTLRVVGDGHPLDEDFTASHIHVGTAIGPVFVWHVFRKLDPLPALGARMFDQDSVPLAPGAPQ